MDKFIRKSELKVSNRAMPSNTFIQIYQWLDLNIDLASFELDVLGRFPKIFIKENLPEIREKITRFIKILEDDLFRGEEENCQQSEYIKIRKITEKLQVLVQKSVELWRMANN